MKTLGTVIALIIIWSLGSAIYGDYKTSNNMTPLDGCAQGHHKIYVQEPPEDAGKYITVCPKGQSCVFKNTGETWTPAPRPTCD